MSNKHENLTSLFVNIADAIREKTGGTATVVADDFPDAIRAIEAGGGGDTRMEDGLVTKTITEYSNNRVESIGSYAFAYCSSLTSVSFPAATMIGG